MFMGFVGALALAAGLAFGLGGRDIASKIVANWYQSAQDAKPKLERAANAAGELADQKACGRLRLSSLSIKSELPPL